MSGKIGTQSPQQVATQERQRQALELRTRGLRYDVIAERLGYANASGAYKAVAAVLKRTTKETALELRCLEGERYDTLLNALWDKAMRGDTFAAEKVIALLDRRAKLFGLDAPTKQDVTVNTAPLQVVPIDYRAALAPLAPGSVDDIPAPGEDQGAGDGQAVG